MRQEAELEKEAEALRSILSSHVDRVTVRMHDEVMERIECISAADACLKEAITAVSACPANDIVAAKTLTDAIVVQRAHASPSVVAYAVTQCTARVQKLQAAADSFLRACPGESPALSNALADPLVHYAHRSVMRVVHATIDVIKATNKLEEALNGNFRPRIPDAASASPRGPSRPRSKWSLMRMFTGSQAVAEALLEFRSLEATDAALASALGFLDDAENDNRHTKTGECLELHPASITVRARATKLRRTNDERLCSLLATPTAKFRARSASLHTAAP